MYTNAEKVEGRKIYKYIIYTYVYCDLCCPMRASRITMYMCILYLNVCICLCDCELHTKKIDEIDGSTLRTI